jgi:hypothetical protein
MVLLDIGLSYVTALLKLISGINNGLDVSQLRLIPRSNNNSED